MYKYMLYTKMVLIIFCKSVTESRNRGKRNRCYFKEDTDGHKL